MNSENKQIDQIIINSILGKISSNEKAMLDTWIESNPENKKKVDDYRSIWENSKELMYSDTIDIELSLLRTKRRIPEFNKKKWMVYLRQAAAVLVLSIVFAGTINYFLKNSESDDQLSYQEVKTAYGTQTNFNLPDGTQVWLNSGSVLRYPKSFTNKDNRSVELKGEGYFSVTKNPSHPFIVKTMDIDIKVLGTEFNVSAYDDYSSTTVALEKGKVSILKNISGNYKELLVLNPNEVVEYNKIENKFLHLQETSIEKYTAWKDGIILFYGDPIETVARKLEKWYNVEIRLADKNLTRYRFTATFANESLDQVLHLLSLSTPLEYEIIPAQKQPDQSYSKRVIIISNK